MRLIFMKVCCHVRKSIEANSTRPKRVILAVSWVTGKGPPPLDNRPHTRAIICDTSRRHNRDPEFCLNVGGMKGGLVDLTGRYLCLFIWTSVHMRICHEVTWKVIFCFCAVMCKVSILQPRIFVSDQITRRRVRHTKSACGKQKTKSSVFHKEIEVWVRAVVSGSINELSS
jgi:hypothetical protein